MTVELAGGLGNQIFELAGLYGLATRYHHTPVVSHSILFTQRRNYWESIFHKIPNTDTSGIEWTRLHEDNLQARETLKTTNVKLTGYYQDVHHFSHIRPELLQLFSLPPTQQQKVNELWSRLPSEPLKIAIHIRRGDYVGLSHIHTNLTLNYYTTAIKTLDWLLPGSKVYLIFSDDIEWCKREFVGSNYIFMEGNDEVIDLFLMTKADGYVLANSSFSWCGWYLNPEAYSRPVIAPRNWFRGFSNGILVEDHFTILDEI